VQGFSNASSTALNGIGLISSEIYDFKATGNGGCLKLNGATSGGVEYDSNENAFFKTDCQAHVRAGGAVIDLVKASANNFFGLHAERNTQPYVLLFEVTSCTITSSVTTEK
jgi:hypothetical protein